MESSQRRDHRRAARTGPRWGRIALLAVGALLAAIAVAWAAVAAVGVLTGAMGRRSAAGTRSPVPAAAAVTTGSPVAKASAAASAASEPATASAQASPEDSDASSSGSAAVAAAALPYPGAPAVKPLTITHLNPREKLVAITLDDGLSYDPRLLDLLEKNHVTATTFLLGQAVVRNPKFVKRLKADGFEIANHTWDHTNLTGLSVSGVKAQLRNTQKVISAITGDQAPYMRPPGGATNASVRRTAASLGYTVVLWNKSFADTSRSATPERLYHNVMDGLKPGDIILCHWKGRDTYEAMVLILPELRRRSYRVVTLSELIAVSGGLPK